MMSGETVVVISFDPHDFDIALRDSTACGSRPETASALS